MHLRLVWNAARLFLEIPPKNSLSGILQMNLYGSKMTAIVLGLASLVPGQAFCDDWITMHSDISWNDGYDCGDNYRCFRLEQVGIGNAFTKDCFRKQIKRTRINNSNLSKLDWRLLSSDGKWQYGIYSVTRNSDSIFIDTFVIQNHGGIFNGCLGNGYGHFTVAIKQ